MWQIRCYKGKLTALKKTCRLLAFSVSSDFPPSSPTTPQASPRPCSAPSALQMLLFFRVSSLSPFSSFSVHCAWASLSALGHNYHRHATDFQTGLLTRFSPGLQSHWCQTERIPRAPPSHVQNRSITLLLRNVAVPL